MPIAPGNTLCIKSRLYERDYGWLSDNDDFGDECDNCPSNRNGTQTDSDLDGVGNACDNCPGVANANCSSGSAASWSIPS